MRPIHAVTAGQAAGGRDEETDMVRTDQMWRYTRGVEVEHKHSSADRESTWSMLTAVTDSPDQGWNFHLEDGCKLQSCFGETEVDVKTIWHEDVLSWGKVAELPPGVE